MSEDTNQTICIFQYHEYGPAFILLFTDKSFTFK